MSTGPQIAETGMELCDLLADKEFASRPRRIGTAERHIAGLRRLAQVFAERPETILQELVDLAVEICGAESAGISLEENRETGEKVFRWVAISGSFAQYANATTPRFFSPCGTCLDSGRPQHYRVTQPYYNHLGVTADDINDGMLIPWMNEYLRGTIWAVAHRSRAVFDLDAYNMLRSLADFASISLRHQRQQEILRDRERQAASAQRANELAHLINNPLQAIANTLFLAQSGTGDTQLWIRQAMDELNALTSLVKNSLEDRSPAPRIPPQSSSLSLISGEKTLKTC